MRIAVEPELCVACGGCTETCPGVFHLDGWTSVVHTPSVPPHLRKACLRAAEECWTGAIVLEERVPELALAGVLSRPASGEKQ